MLKPGKASLFPLATGKVIGSVDTAEFAVSGAASLGFLIGIGTSGIHWGFALALLAGGIAAASLAAYLVKIAPAHVLGVAVGGMIVLTNLRTIFISYEVPASAAFPHILPCCWLLRLACTSPRCAASGGLLLAVPTSAGVGSTPECLRGGRGR